MSKYTLEEVSDRLRRAAKLELEASIPRGSVEWLDMAYAIDASLRERESAKTAVTDEIARAALNVQEAKREELIGSEGWKPYFDADLPSMRAALEAVAPMLASARVPDERKAAMYADESRQDHYEAAIYDKGWNDCRKAMLAATPKPETE